MKRPLLTLLTFFTLASTAPAERSAPPEKIAVSEAIRPGTRIAVIHFRDCILLERVKECPGSGESTSTIYATALAQKLNAKISISARPGTGFDELSDAAAISIGKDKQAEYVLVGTVDEYHDVKPMTGRTDGAGLTVKLIKVETGSVVAAQSEKMVGRSNFSSPQKLMRGAADRFQKALLKGPLKSKK